MRESDRQVHKDSRLFAEVSEALLRHGNAVRFRVAGESTRPNLLDVQAGSESHFVEQGKAYQVRAENEVSYHQYLSPDDGDCHRYHEHRLCAPVEMVKGHAPVAAGQSRFLIVSAVVVTGVAAVSISEALESPHRP